MAIRQNPGSTSPGWPDTPEGLDRLLVRVARGDREAFAAVYGQVAGPVYGLAHWMVGDPARAEHVAGDVLAEVWRTAPKFSPADGSGISWIMAIARRHAVRHVRVTSRHAGRRAAAAPDLAQLVEDISERAGLDQPPMPDAGLPGEAAGLAALPEPQRQALVLVCYGGYGQGQAAALLGVPDGTVAGWIREGLPLLADAAS